MTSACAMTAFLRSSMASSMPVPRPVTSAAIDPNEPRSAPRPRWCCRSPCRRSPAGAHRRRSTARPRPARHRERPGPPSVVMAGSTARFRVPGATLRRTSASESVGMGVATPTSTTTTSAPTCRARTLMAAPPAQKFATICAVTSWGHGVTPSATTPWSPAKTATVTGAGTGGGQTPAMALRRIPMSSTRSERSAGLGQPGLELGRGRRGTRRRPGRSCGRLRGSSDWS